ncbi:hypothetical protein Q428_02710 [Fervidicella metallireducens AeB]|uniref:Uncharacterized protein n=1 Tax=Fervidicella metallireducens AeB TaxID=1403537 RepID=A0A017RXP8_9CLOT|nr:NusG domain II-containing protein [Fervidicella metallireducens]EYE89361.1 hypothetical protein Q428_02710 [Fervidicella metallireducens AeB]
MKKYDWLIIIGIILISGLLFGVNQLKLSQQKRDSKELIAEITVKGQLYKQVVLTKEKQEFTIRTDIGKNTVSIHDNGIEVIESDCHDHICEKMGFIQKPGDIIVCLPNKIFIKIVGNSEGDIDEVSR